jgi:CheY-like chemotaxis protein
MILVCDDVASTRSRRLTAVSRILIVRGEDETDAPLRACLLKQHECTFVSDLVIAIRLLRLHRFDAIICSTHYSGGDIFAFIHRLKTDKDLKTTPVICMTCERSPLATRLDKLSGNTAMMMGADRFLSLDNFCERKESSSCRNCTMINCQLSRLRQEIELIIREHSHKIPHSTL